MNKFLAAKTDGRVAKRVKEDDNILGIGIGPKEVGEKPTDRMALKFFVRTKRDKADLAAKDLLPKSVSVDRGKVDTDVVQMAPLRARGSFKQRLRPGQGGCSGCVVVPGLNYTGTLGLGMRGYGWLAERAFILSNNHVLANENRSRIGDAVVQPGTLDGGDPAADKIGELYDFVPLKFGGAVNKVDAACAQVSTWGDFTREIFWVGHPRGWRTRGSVNGAVSAGNTQVQKTGRTTGYTTGQIAAVAFDGWVGYETGDAYFEDQLLITPGSFSDAGDSGSCILDMQEHIVGLLFAGGATHTVANYIEDVWNELGPIDFSDGRV
ncbi:MAG: trypsin-like peptidase domain-containing protein [bacterium]|nr:trypsin-like peptidase domain-containing protein [bacterium]